MIFIQKIFLRESKRLIFISLCVFGISSQALAAIVYLDDNRRVVNAGGDGNGGSSSSTILPDAPFADMNALSQTSVLSSTGFSASGYGYAYSDFGWSSTDSFFDITFSLTTESIFTLTGNLTGQDILYGSGDAYIDFYSGTTLLYSNSVNAIGGGYEEAILNFNSILQAGDYRLSVRATPYFQEADSSFSITAGAVSTVPVPAAVWLFGSGLIALAGFSRRKA